MTLVPYSYRISSCNRFLDVCLCMNSLIENSCYLLVYRPTFFSLNYENSLVLILLANHALSNPVVVC